MAQQNTKPHMREMTLREIQLAEYALLCKTADVMEAHGLSYFLCGGTLLGPSDTMGLSHGTTISTSWSPGRITRC